MAPSSPTLPLIPLDAVRPTRGRPVRLLGGVAAAAVGAASIALLYAAAVLDATGRRIDDGTMRVAMRVGAALRSEILLVLDVAAPAATAAVALLVVLAWRRGRRHAALVATAVVLGSQGVTQALKAWLPAVHAEGNSLPSGHVTVAVTTIVAVALLVPRSVRALRVLAVPIVAATGLATMTVGWHRPSDVLAAVAVVVTVGGLTTAASGLGELRGRDHDRRTGSEGLGSVTDLAGPWS